MVIGLLRTAGARGRHLRAMSVASMGMCVVMWLGAKTLDQDQRGNAERRALFVGLWPPTLWLIGDTLDRHRSSLERLLDQAA